MLTNCSVTPPRRLLCPYREASVIENYRSGGGEKKRNELF